jgi:hypothetical protein
VLERVSRGQLRTEISPSAAHGIDFALPLQPLAARSHSLWPLRPQPYGVKIQTTYTIAVSDSLCLKTCKTGRSTLPHGLLSRSSLASERPTDSLAKTALTVPIIMSSQSQNEVKFCATCAWLNQKCHCTASSRHCCKF